MGSGIWRADEGGARRSGQRKTKAMASKLLCAKARKRSIMRGPRSMSTKAMPIIFDMKVRVAR